MNENQRELLINKLVMLKYCQAAHPLKSVIGIATGLLVHFDGGKLAFIPWGSMRGPCGHQPATFVSHNRWSATMSANDGKKVKIHANTLMKLATPGGRAALERVWAQTEFSFRAAVRICRETLEMSLALAAARAGISEARLAEIECGAWVTASELTPLLPVLKTVFAELCFFERHHCGGELHDRIVDAGGPKVVA